MVSLQLICLGQGRDDNGQFTTHLLGQGRDDNGQFTTDLPCTMT